MEKKVKLMLTAEELKAIHQALNRNTDAENFKAHRSLMTQIRVAEVDFFMDSIKDN